MCAGEEEKQGSDGANYLNQHQHSCQDGPTIGSNHDRSDQPSQSPKITTHQCVNQKKKNRTLTKPTTGSAPTLLPRWADIIGPPIEIQGKPIPHQTPDCYYRYLDYLINLELNWKDHREDITHRHPTATTDT